MVHFKEYVGEALGTFILVLFGCSSVAVAVLFKSFGSLLEIALVWGIGVALAIFSVRAICPAHLNPAVSIAMGFAKKLKFSKLPFYIMSQLVGAFIATTILFLIFEDAILLYEKTNGIIRGSKASIQSAQFFGEYYPNPGFADKLTVSTSLACFMEGFGTFILVFVIFRLTEKKEQIDNLTPLLIGLTVTCIICLVAPFTQAGLNPARDFAPRIVAYLFGWKNAAFPPVEWSFLTVYILSPIFGGILAHFINKILESKLP